MGRVSRNDGKCKVSLSLIKDREQLKQDFECTVSDSPTVLYENKVATITINKVTKKNPS